MSDPQQPGPLAAVLDALKATTEELTATKAEVTALKGEAQYLRRYGHRNRFIIIFDITLTVLLSGVGALSVHAVQSASQANSAQLALCQAGNTSRAEQIQLWDYALRLSAKTQQTAQQRQAATEFRAYLAKVFASRDCNRLGR